jgi:putative hemolysin
MVYTLARKPAFMESRLLLEISILIILILLNGVFAHGRTGHCVIAPRTLADAGRQRPQRRFASPSKCRRSRRALLSTVQVGITLIGILAGAFGGASLSA